MRSDAELPASGFLTAVQVRSRYQISNSCLYTYIAAGVLPRPVKIGPRAVRFSVDSLRRFEEALVPTDCRQGKA